MATYDDYDRMVKLLPRTVGKSLSIVSAGVLNHQLFHMSTSDRIRKFTPGVTRRTGNRENRSVPRVSTAPTLLGCFIGYCAARGDFMFNSTKADKTYHHGWYLYRIPFEFALKPEPKLLYDQLNSDEHWLVTASEDTREYKADIVAKCFYGQITFKARTGKSPTPVTTMYVQVFDESVPFGQTTVLTKGCWRIEGPDPSNHVEFWKDDEEYTVTNIDQGEWVKVKKISADLLSYAPPYIEW